MVRASSLKNSELDALGHVRMTSRLHLAKAEPLDVRRMRGAGRELYLNQILPDRVASLPCLRADRHRQTMAAAAFMNNAG